jgi:hypothetical protein
METAHAALITSVWDGPSGTGGTGNWSTGSSWSNGTAPNNTAFNQYAVRIDDKTKFHSRVNLNINAAIDKLYIGPSLGDQLFVNNGKSLTVVNRGNGQSGVISNSRLLSLNSSGSTTELLLSGSVALSGSGSLSMTNSAANRIRGLTGSTVLVNQGNTIRGSGFIGMNSMALTNQATIIADQSVALIVDPNATGITNSGVMRADGGILRLQSGTFANTPGGLIEALGGSRVELSAATVTAGTLDTTSTGRVQVVSNSTITNVSNEGLLEINNGQTLSVSGTLSNSGNLDLDGTSSATVLRFLGDLSLSGGGFVSLGSQNDQVTASSNVHRLTNVDNTIVGQGKLGMNVLEIRNESLIHASVPSSILTVDPGSGGLTNMDTMRASGGGILRLSGGAFSNGGSAVIEAQNSSRVEMFTANVSGGTLQTSGSGVIRVASSNLLNGLSNTGLMEVTSGNNLLQNVNNSGTIQVLGGSNNRLANADNSGSVEILNAQTLMLQGGLTNSGGVEVTSTGSPTELTIDGNLSVGGGGSITLAGPAARIVGRISSNSLTNVDNTIEGTGMIGNNAMALTNQGLVDANVPGAYLYIDPNSTPVVNSGVMRAGGGTLRLQSGTFANTPGGVIEALGGSRVELSAATVTAGTLDTT